MATSTVRAALGAAGEQVAVGHLHAAGMTIVARNWRFASPELRGEVDIVALDGPTLVVVEVKARRGRGAGEPAEAVTPRKLAQLRALAGAYLAQADQRVDQARIDVVAVRWPARGGTPEITHLRGVGGW